MSLMKGQCVIYYGQTLMIKELVGDYPLEVQDGPGE